MDWTAPFSEGRAISPVIGVILMVAILVTLAAFVGTFVLDLGDTNEAAPNPTFETEFDVDDASVTFTVTGGEEFYSETILVAGNETVAADQKTLLSDTDAYPEVGGETILSARDTFTIDLDPTLDEMELRHYEIRLIWESQESDHATTIYQEQGPGI